jgi:hypothetical protein
MEEGVADELGGAFAGMHPTQLVIGTVPLRLVRVLTTTALLSADVILFGKTPRSHLP